MTELRRAAEMALEALEDVGQAYGSHSEWFKKRLEALRQALAESANSTTNLVEPKASSQTEQEPVAWSDIVSDGGLDPRNAFDTAPPKREWVGLTDEEIEDLWNQHEPRFDYYSFSCDIEAKLKDKNT